MRMHITDSGIYLSDLDAVINSVNASAKLSSRRVLVTGAGGMLGAFIVDTLLRMNDLSGTGVHVYAAGRNIDRLKARFGERQDIEYIRHDLMGSLDADICPDYVIHTAGNSDPAAFNSDPVGTVMGNIGGTYELLRLAKDKSCARFLYVSSGEIYGQGDPETDSYEESYSGYVDPVSVRSCYPVSKRAAENLCVSYGAEYGLETVIVRPCHIYGPTYKEGDSHAYVQFLRNALSGNDIVMKSAGTQTRSYIYVADCAAGLLTALIRGENGQAYNIANPGSVVSIAGLAQTIADSAGVRVVCNEPDDKDIRDRSPIPRQVLNADKLINIGFNPFYTIEKGIEHTYNILKDIAV